MRDVKEVKRNKVYVGDNIEVLKTFPDNSIDSVVTDPPYGLGKEPNAVEVLQSWIEKGYHEVKGKGFMGKEWDAFVPQPMFWKEIYRVLKPGGHVLSFAGTRTYDWMVMAIRLAGFEIRDQIAWVYGSGFPKSHNIGKAIDALNKTGGSSPQNMRKTRMGEDYKPTGQQDYKKGRMFSTDIENDDRDVEIDNEWQGWGTALKPALEPIVMARKPLDGTVAQNVLKYGVGGINIDECRIDYNGEVPNVGGRGNHGRGDGYGFKPMGEIKANTNGRFPANFIHDGSDEVLKLFPNTQSSAGSFKASDYKQGDGVTNFTRGDFEGYGDEGSAARFFYVPKASQEERNFGLYDFEEKYTASAEFRPNHMEKALEGEDGNPYDRWQPRKNIHPTVKPIELMRYLVRLVTPKNGICLDPYLGSGTTAIACKMENINYIGIELMPEYAEIAKARISAVKDFDPTLDTKTIIKESIKEDKEEELGIMNIFDFLEEE